MALIYITGISGSGKSTIIEELKKRGYEGHDADKEGFNGWIDINTGKSIQRDDSIEYASPEWYKKYVWKTSRSKVEDLEKSSKNKIVFLAGVSSNEQEVWDLFSKVICLIIDEKTLRERVAQRTNNDFGKKENELHDILDWHTTYPGDYPNLGAVIINASRSLDTVVDEILKHLTEK